MLTKLFIHQINRSPCQRRDITSRDCSPSSGFFLRSASQRKKPSFPWLPCVCQHQAVCWPTFSSPFWLGGEWKDYWTRRPTFSSSSLFSSVGLSSVKIAATACRHPAPLRPPSSGFFLVRDLGATKNLEDMIKPLPRLAVLSWSFFGDPGLGDFFLLPLCWGGGRKPNERCRASVLGVSSRVGGGLHPERPTPREIGRWGGGTYPGCHFGTA